MKIVFNCHKESARFSVSPSPGVEEYKIGEDTVRHCEPCHEKTRFLPMRKQRPRSALQ